MAVHTCSMAIVGELFLSCALNLTDTSSDLYLLVYILRVWHVCFCEAVCECKRVVHGV